MAKEWDCGGLLVGYDGEAPLTEELEGGWAGTPATSFPEAAVTAAFPFGRILST